MRIKSALRKELEILLPKNYRQVIVDRLSKKGITVHPNTVRNVLHGSENNAVARELLKLCEEMKSSDGELVELAQQFSKKKVA